MNDLDTDLLIIQDVAETLAVKVMACYLRNLFLQQKMPAELEAELFLSEDLFITILDLSVGWTDSDLTLGDFLESRTPYESFF